MDRYGSEFLLEMSRRPGTEGEIYHDLYMACNTGVLVVLSPNQREHLMEKVKLLSDLKKLTGGSQSGLEWSMRYLALLTLQESLAAYINTCRG